VPKLNSLEKRANKSPARMAPAGRNCSLYLSCTVRRFAPLVNEAIDRRLKSSSQRVDSGVATLQRRRKYQRDTSFVGIHQNRIAWKGSASRIRMLSRDRQEFGSAMITAGRQYAIGVRCGTNNRASKAPIINRTEPTQPRLMARTTHFRSMTRPKCAWQLRQHEIQLLNDAYTSCRSGWPSMIVAPMNRALYRVPETGP
jgi:hypothetical protein